MKNQKLANIQKIQQNLSKLLNIKEEKISLKATTQKDLDLQVGKRV